MLSFCRVRDSVVDCVNDSSSARVELNHGLRDGQCAPTKVGIVLKAKIKSVTVAMVTYYGIKSTITGSQVTEVCVILTL